MLYRDYPRRRWLAHEADADAERRCEKGNGCAAENGAVVWEKLTAAALPTTERPPTRHENEEVANCCSNLLG